MSSTSSEASHPPTPTRRVVTGHTPSGDSIIVEDEPIPPRPFNGTPSFFTDLYWTDKSVPDNDVEFKDLAKEHPHELIGPEGSSLKVVWLPPGQVSVSFCLNSTTLTLSCLIVFVIHLYLCFCFCSIFSQLSISLSNHSIFII